MKLFALGLIFAVAGGGERYRAQVLYETFHATEFGRWCACKELCRSWNQWLAMELAARHDKYQLIEVNMKAKNLYVAVLCVLSTGAYALPVASLGSSAVVSFVENNPGGASVGTPCRRGNTTGAMVECSGVATTPYGNALNYSSTATSDYGVLKAGGQSSINTPIGTSNSDIVSRTSGTARFRDAWTINGGTGSGTLQLKFHLDGTYDFGTPGSTLSSGFGLQNFTNNTYATNYLSFGAVSGIVDADYILTTAFDFGSQFEFEVYLSAGSTISQLGWVTYSSLDLSHTAILNEIVVRDANGDVIPFGLSTISGAALFDELAMNANPTQSVPEPGTLALLGIGVMGIAFGRRKYSSIDRSASKF
jgi:hypothetical protein